jgi:hypothetical protein
MPVAIVNPMLSHKNDNKQNISNNKQDVTEFLHLEEATVWC